MPPNQEIRISDVPNKFFEVFWNIFDQGFYIRPGRERGEKYLKILEGEFSDTFIIKPIK